MKRFGMLGVVLMGLHILFHVIECLVLPSIFVALSSHLSEEQAMAANNDSEVVVNAGMPSYDDGIDIFNFTLTADLSANYIPELE